MSMFDDEIEASPSGVPTLLGAMAFCIGLLILALVRH